MTTPQARIVRHPLRTCRPKTVAENVHRWSVSKDRLTFTMLSTVSPHQFEVQLPVATVLESLGKLPAMTMCERLGPEKAGQFVRLLMELKESYT